MITDSHVLVWAHDPAPRTGQFLDHGPIPMSASRLVCEMDAAGVDRAVVIPPGWDPDGTEAQSAVARHPDRIRRLLRVALDDPDEARRIARWREAPGVIGVRASFWPIRARRWIADGTADWLWAAAERAGIPVTCFAPHAVPALGSIAARRPDLRIVVEHLGMSVELDPSSQVSAIDDLTTLARLPNVAVNASALPSYARDGYPFASVHGHIARVLDAFGAERVFWGSDLSRLPCSYREAVDLFREALPLSDDERSLVLGAGFARWFDWPGVDESRAGQRPVATTAGGVGE